MKDFKLPVTLENTTESDLLVCLVPASAELAHELAGKFLTDKSFQAVVIIGLNGEIKKPSEDDVIFVSGLPLSLAKIQRYISFSEIQIKGIDVMSLNGEQLGVSFSQRTHDAVTVEGYEDFELAEIGELVLKKAEDGKRYAEHDFVTPFKSGAFDSLMYVVKAKTKVDLIIDATYTAISNAVAVPGAAPVADEGVNIAPIL